MEQMSIVCKSNIATILFLKVEPISKTENPHFDRIRRIHSTLLYCLQKKNLHTILDNAENTFYLIIEKSQLYYCRIILSYCSHIYIQSKNIPNSSITWDQYNDCSKEILLN